MTRVDYVAQNGRKRTQKVKLKARCGKGKKRARHKRHRRK